MTKIALVLIAASVALVLFFGALGTSQEAALAFDATTGVGATGGEGDGADPSSLAAPDVDPLCERYNDYSDGRSGRRSECQALVDLYNFTSGSGWTDNGGRDGGWLKGSYCFWNGVVCRGGYIPGDPTHQLVGLSLIDNNLETYNLLPDEDGLPISIGDLGDKNRGVFKGLTFLYLDNNSTLSGTLPLELMNLKLTAFHYDGTNLCPPKKPADVAQKFENWLESIPNLLRNECADYELTGLEVTQSIQNLQNDIPLVKGKHTYVIAHVQVPEGKDPIKDVTARLIVKRSGQTTLYPSNPGGKITILPVKKGPSGEIIQPERGDLDHSFYFEIPWDLLEIPGTISFEFKPSNDSTKVSCREDGGGGDCRIDNLAILDITNPEVRFFSVVYTDTQNIRREPDIHAWVDTVINTEQMLPWSFLTLKTGTLPWPGQGKPDTISVVHLLSKMKADPKCVGPNNSDCLNIIYYGLIDDPNPPLLRGWGEWSYDNNYQLIAPKAGASIYDPRRPNDMAHELGHTFGIPHVPTGCNEPPPLAGSDYEFDYHPHGYISEFEDGPLALFGFRTNDRQYMSPTTKDMMGYCLPNWISDYEYNYVWNETDRLFDLGRQSAHSNSPLQGSDVVLLSGLIDPIADTGSLDPVVSYQSGISFTIPLPGSYAIQFQDLGGQELTTYNFEPPMAAPGPNRAFSLLLPRPIDTARIILLHNDVELDAQIASANPPSVIVISPNGGELLSGDTATVMWSASDKDGDNLEYLIKYSSDGGLTWQTLHPSWPDTIFKLDLNTIPGSNQALIRVLASDGFYTTADQSDSVFSVASKPPTAVIIGNEGATFWDGQYVNLEGKAFDYENGDLSGTALTWSSSRDGVLGHDQQLSVQADLLARGVHTITLSAQDSDGMIGTDSITVTIERPETITYTINQFIDVVDANIGDDICDSDLTTDGEQCSLRAAIQEANASENYTVIVLPAGLYELAIPGSDDTAAAGDLDINLKNTKLTIRGAGPDQTFIDAGLLSQSPDRVFDIHNSTVTLLGITIRKGSIAGNGLSKYSGGGIYIQASNVTISDTIVTHNTASFGGGIGVSYQSQLTLENSIIRDNTASFNIGQDFGYGGGIASWAGTDPSMMTSITVINSTIEGNSGQQGGGLNIEGDLNIMNSVVINNQAANGNGGGIFGYWVKDVSITDSTVRENIASSNNYGFGDGGGIHLPSPSSDGQITLKNIDVISNTATGAGGGIYTSISGSTIISATIQGNTAENGGGFYGTGGVTFYDSVFNNNTASNAGGGISGKTNLVNSSVTHNTAGGNGGGINGGGVLTETLVSYNSAGGSGGGLSILRDTIVQGSTIDHNTAANAGGGLYVAYAYRDGVTGEEKPRVEIINSTISDNRASQGGGIDDSGGVSTSGRFTSQMFIYNSTISHNTADIDGGGIYHYTVYYVNTLTMNLENTIVSNNAGGNCGGYPDDEDFISEGHNLSSDTTCTKFTKPGDLTNTDPLLGPLQDNGGPTETRELAKDSPAVDAANDSTCPATDQRRFSRPNGLGCDIGAYEYMPKGAVLWVNPSALTFETSVDGGVYTQTIGIGNPEDRLASWTANEQIPWLTLGATSGRSMPAVLDIKVDNRGLSEGTYTGQIVISSPDLGDSPQTVDVTLIVGAMSDRMYLPLVTK